MRTVDLHVHSDKSDGSFAPAALVDLAAAKGLSAFALTDHDTTAGIREATEAGKKKAEGIYERHSVLTKALMKMGAEEHIAEENACRIEHVVSEEMMQVFKKFIES